MAILDKKLYEVYFFFALVLLIFTPKINLISIPGFWQGIRLDDILVLSYIVFFFIRTKSFIITKNFIYTPGLILFCYLFFVNLISVLNGNEIKYIMLLRLCEYFALFYFINEVKIDKKTIHKIFVIFIIINTVISYFQSVGVVGYFSSRGYFETRGGSDSSLHGLAGGSWELGIFLTLSFLIIIKNTDNLVRDYFIFTPMILFQIIMSFSKTNMVIFSLIILFMFPLILKKIINKEVKIQIIYYIVTFLLFLIVIIIKSRQNLSLFEYAIPYYQNFDYDGFFAVLKEFIRYRHIPVQETIHESLNSLWYRLEAWKHILNLYFSNNINIIFGVGFSKFMYLESTYIRVITSFGIIGSFLVCFYALRMSFFILLYLMVLSFSYDIFVSFKIFVFFLILQKTFIETTNIKKNIMNN